MNREAIRRAASVYAQQYDLAPTSEELVHDILAFDGMALLGPEAAAELSRLRSLPREEAVRQILESLR